LRSWPGGSAFAVLFSAVKILGRAGQLPDGIEEYRRAARAVPRIGPLALVVAYPPGARHEDHAGGEPVGDVPGVVARAGPQLERTEVPRPRRRGDRPDHFGRKRRRRTPPELGRAHLDALGPRSHRAGLPEPLKGKVQHVCAPRPEIRGQAYRTG